MQKVHQTWDQAAADAWQKVQQTIRQGALLHGAASFTHASKPTCHKDPKAMLCSVNVMAASLQLRRHGPCPRIQGDCKGKQHQLLHDAALSTAAGRQVQWVSELPDFNSMFAGSALQQEGQVC